jgi:hypothetical protein
MISILKKALSAHPFEPVTVVTSNGASVIIKHREFAAVLARAGVLYVELPEEEEPRFIGLRHIKEVRAKNLVPDDEEPTEERPPFS